MRMPSIPHREILWVSRVISIPVGASPWIVRLLSIDRLGLADELLDLDIVIVVDDHLEEVFLVQSRLELVFPNEEMDGVRPTLLATPEGGDHDGVVAVEGKCVGHLNLQTGFES